MSMRIGEGRVFGSRPVFFSRFVRAYWTIMGKLSIVGVGRCWTGVATG